MSKIQDFIDSGMGNEDSKSSEGFVHYAENVIPKLDILAQFGIDPNSLRQIF